MELKNGIAKDVANFVFTKIEPFAQYGFNKVTRLLML